MRTFVIQGPHIWKNHSLSKWITYNFPRERLFFVASITLPLISSSFHFIVSCPQFYHRTHSSQTHYIGFLALAEESDSSGSGESSNKLFVTAICLPRKFRDLSTSLESRESRRERANGNSPPFLSSTRVQRLAKYKYWQQPVWNIRTK